MWGDLTAVLLEIPPIRRRLVLLGRHQPAVRAQVVGFVGDADMDVVFGADVLTPPDRLVGDDAVIDPAVHLRPRQSIVDGGDLVMEQVVPGLVDVDALLGQSFIVLMEGDAGVFIGAGGSAHGLSDRSAVFKHAAGSRATV